MQNTPKIFSFSCKGRYGRLNAINALMLTAIIASGLAAVLPRDTLVAELPAFATMIYSFRVYILRLHDMGRPEKLVIPVIILYMITSMLSFAAPEMAIAVVLSAISVIVSIVLLAIPGTTGENLYGPQPAKGSIAGLIAAILIPLFTLLIIFMYAE